MVRLTKNKIIIEIEPEYPPADVLYDLQQALLRALQNQGDKLDTQQQKDVYLCLLFLLEEMHYVQQEKKR